METKTLIKMNIVAYAIFFALAAYFYPGDSKAEEIFKDINIEDVKSVEVIKQDITTEKHKLTTVVTVTTTYVIKRKSAIDTAMESIKSSVSTAIEKTEAQRKKAVEYTVIAMEKLHKLTH